MPSSFVERTKCPACLETNLSELKNVPFLDPSVGNFLRSYYLDKIPKAVLENESFVIEECQSCGLLFQKHILNDENIAKLYDQWIPEEDSFNKKKKANISLFNRYAKEVEEIMPCFPEQKPFEINVLDFGMGWGFWLQMVKAFGFNAYGFELSETRIKYAREQGIKVFENFEQLNEYKFDYINMEQVLEHVVEPLEILQSLSGLLNVNGVLLLSVPDGKEVKNELIDTKWEASKDVIHPLEHINCFSHHSLRAIGEKVGLAYIPKYKVSKFRFVTGRKSNSEIKTTRIAFRKLNT